MVNLFIYIFVYCLAEEDGRRPGQRPATCPIYLLYTYARVGISCTIDRMRCNLNMRAMAHYMHSSMLTLVLWSWVSRLLLIIIFFYFLAFVFRKYGFGSVNFTRASTATLTPSTKKTVWSFQFSWEFFQLHNEIFFKFNVWKQLNK